MPNKVDRAFLQKVKEKSLYYYKDENLFEHTQLMYLKSLDRPKAIKEDEDKQAELLAACFIMTRKSNYPMSVNSSYPALYSLVGMSKNQIGALSSYYNQIDQIDEIDENGEVKIVGDKMFDPDEPAFFEEEDSFDEPENIVEDQEINIKIDINNNEISTSVRENAHEEENNYYYSTNDYVIDAKLIDDVFRSQYLEDFIEGEQPRIVDEEVNAFDGIDHIGPNEVDDIVIHEDPPKVSMHTYLRNRLNDLQVIENDNQDMANKKKVAKGRLEVYSALDQRSRDRSFLDVILHPYNTYKEWSLKKDLGNMIKEKYHLNDQGLKKVADMCNGECGNDIRYFDNNGREFKEEIKLEEAKPLDEFDIRVNNFVDEILHPNKSLDNLARSTDIFISNEKSEQIDLSNSKKVNDIEIGIQDK